MPESILVATSLAPGKREDVQRRALASWRALGFEIVSFNSALEIARLQPAFPEVVFHDPGRTAEFSTGKPLIFVADILAWFKEKGPRVCGIVNSDILLDPPGDLAAFARAEALGSLVIGTRVEIEEIEQRQGKRNLWGFDLFFFDRALIDVFVDHKFCLGMPFWDYWMPFTAALHGLPLKQIDTDVAFHMAHDEAWTSQRFLYSHMFVEFLLAEIARKQASSGALDDPLLTFLQGFLSVYYRKIHTRLLGRETPDVPDQEKFHVAAQFVEFCDALNETTFLFLRRQAQRIGLPPS
jgi:hypothetical protein